MTFWRKIHTVTAFLVLFPAASSCTAEPETYERLRERMVNEQIAARGVSDARVLKAMREVPRHMFVPERYRSSAYQDTPLSIGEGQTISQPYIVAFMTEVLMPEPDHRVLEIGTGSGYQAAILAELVSDVYTIEIIESLANRAEERLKDLGYENVYIKVGDGYKGWPEKAPFDAIMVTAAPEKIPQPLIDQLREGGRMIVPVGTHYSVQKLVLGIKTNGELKRKNILPVRFVPMVKGEE